MTMLYYAPYIEHRLKITVVDVGMKLFDELFTVLSANLRLFVLGLEYYEKVPNPTVAYMQNY